ncbi:MAG: hypothetical protein HZA10_02025 [Nitrospirae bacterium]|nr:hypothetical protein [Nitrospirota bacterium]
MKKTIVLTFSIFIFLCMTMSAYSAVVSIHDKHAVIGETIEMPVLVDDAAGIAGFKLNITYDASVLEVTGVSAGKLTAVWMVTPNTNTAGELRVAGVDMTLSGLQAGKGSLAVVQFKVIGKTTKDSAAVGFNICTLLDSKGAVINSTTNAGKIKVSGGK